MSGPTSARLEKRFLPLESNPEVFTRLIKTLGVQSLEFVDVYSLDEPDLLAMVPRPVLALILVFPTTNDSYLTTDSYWRHRAQGDADREAYSGSGEDEDVVWYRQTIRNACGLYAILHAVSNGNARKYIEQGSLMNSLLAKCIPLKPQERAEALEDSAALEEAHARAANQGDSAVPPLEVEVDFHYLSFVPSLKREGRLFELDGARKCPIETLATATGEDILDAGIRLVKDYVDREKGENLNFGLMALVPSDA